MTDLTEKWKKGELENGFYYVKGADCLLGMMSDYALYRVNLEHRDNEIKLLAPVPSYEEYLEMVGHCGAYSTANDCLKEENQQLRQLLKDLYKKTDSYLVGEKNGFKELGWHEKAAEFDNLLTRINTAIGESEER